MIIVKFVRKNLLLMIVILLVLFHKIISYKNVQVIILMEKFYYQMLNAITVKKTRFLWITNIIICVLVYLL